MDERCTDVEPLLSAWLDGELDEQETDQVTAHLAGCEACAGELDGLSVVAAMLGNLPVRRAAADLAAGARARADGGPQAGRRAQVLAVATGLLVGAAFALGAGDGQERALPAPLDAFVTQHPGDAARGQATTPIFLELKP